MAYRATGTLSPDVTGLYLPYGSYGGEPSYKHASLGWYLWYAPTVGWFVTQAVSVTAGPRWQRVSGAAPLDTYYPGGGAAGVLTLDGPIIAGPIVVPGQAAVAALAGTVLVDGSIVVPGTGEATLAGGVLVDGAIVVPGQDAVARLRDGPVGSIVVPGQDAAVALVGGPIVSGAIVVPGQSAVAAITAIKTYYLTVRGAYRIFNAAEYRFYRSNSAPPAEGSSPFATNATLPHTPADTFADGVWYLSASYFNGVLDSGFLPVGPHGETYLRLEIASGAEVVNPPAAPRSVRLSVQAGGVIRVTAIYFESEAAARADQWAIAYTTNGADPPTDTPTITPDLGGSGLAVLVYDLPAQAHGVTVKVRLQTRIGDAPGPYSYSDGSTVLTAVADAQGPAAPLAGRRWSGLLPEDL